MKQIKKIFILLILINMNSIFAQKTVTHYPKKSQNITIKNIDMVEFKDGDNFELIIFGDEKDLKNIKVENNTIYSISYKGSKKNDKLKVVIVKPFENSSEFNFYNIGFIESKQELNSKILKLNLFNIGIIDLALSSDLTSLKGNNISNIKIKGNTSSLELQFKTIAILDLKNFVAKDVFAEIDMCSITKIQALNTIDGSVKMCSTFEIIGNPNNKLNMNNL